MSQLPLAAFIEARLELAPTNSGGRESSIRSGYRCPCWIGTVTDEGPEKNDASFFLVSDAELGPGDSGIVRILPSFPDAWSKLEVGSVIELTEGGRTIGTATVTALFPAVGSQ